MLSGAVISDIQYIAGVCNLFKEHLQQAMAHR